MKYDVGLKLVAVSLAIFTVCATTSLAAPRSKSKVGRAGSKQALRLAKKQQNNRKKGASRGIASVSEASEKRSSQLVINPVGSMFSYTLNEKLVGANLDIPTGINMGVNLRYQIQWSPQFYTAIKGSFLQYTLSMPSGYTFVNQSGSLMGGGLELGYYSGRLKTSLGANYQQELFVRGQNLTTYRFDRIPIIQPYLGLDFDLIRGSGFNLGIGGTLTGLLSANSSGYQIGMGYRYGGQLYLFKSFGSQSDSGLRVRFKYEQSKQNSNVADQQDTRMSGDLGLVFGF